MSQEKAKLNVCISMMVTAYLEVEVDEAADFYRCRTIESPAINAKAWVLGGAGVAELVARVNEQVRFICARQVLEEVTEAIQAQTENAGLRESATMPPSSDLKC